MDDDALANFTAITGTAPDRAQQYLRLTDGNLEQAFELFYANDGADLEGAASPPPTQQPPQAVSHLPSSTTSSGRGHGMYGDAGPIVQVDSDTEQDLSDDEVQITGAGRRPQPLNGSSRPSTRTPDRSAASASDHNTVDEDEVMARRLQEEYYRSTGTGGNVDPEGVRAPIARTTETLVGPGSFDPNDEEMRMAVLQQMRARRQPRPRGNCSRSLFLAIANCYTRPARHL